VTALESPAESEATTASAESGSSTESSAASDTPVARPRDLWDRLVSVELIGGVDTPFGVFGGAVVITPVRYLAFDLGGGASRDGGRVAGGARLVLPHANGAFGVRLGFAGGPLSWETQVGGTSGPDEVSAAARTDRRVWEFSGFVDASISVEFRFDPGIYARLMLGVEHALSMADSCVATSANSGQGMCARGEYQPTRAYIGLAVGYAFDI
jgi:hypothetical protein